MHKTIGQISVIMMAVGALAVLWLVISIAGAHAKDNGQWEDTTYEVKNWFRHLMMPDSPSTSCCGEADGYWTDSFEIKDGRLFAIITDDRDDVKLQRRHIDIGTRIEVPPKKIKYGPDDPQRTEDNKNPTGHGVIFVGPGPMNNNVYCYVMPTGV
jgi:hypothetical protein